MSAMPIVLPPVPGSAALDTAPAGALADTSGEPDFAQVLDALLSPARVVGPALVAGVGDGGAAPDSAAPAQGDDQPTDGTAEAAAQGLTTPQAVPQALLIPTARVAPPTEAAAGVPEGTVAAPTPPAFARGPARAFEAAGDESAQKRAALDLAPGMPVSPAKIAAEVMPTEAPEAPTIASTALDTVGNPATILGDTASSVPSGADLLGLVPPSERAARESSAALPADPIRGAFRLDAPDFADEFGSRVVWMAGRNQQVAELRIDPPRLGPVEVKLSLSNDQANLVLLSPHASVRDALQATLPRLHDLLAAVGINLGSVHVGAHSHSGAHTGDQPGPGRHASGDATLPATMIQASSWVAGGRGMVDVYA